MAVPIRTPRHIVALSLRGAEPALALRPIDAERIELRELVQKSRLRRDRDDDASVAQQDRLAQLQVPVPHGELLPLEGGEREFGTFEKIKRRPRVGGMPVRR